MTNQTNNDELFLVKRMMEGDMPSFRYFFDKYYTDLCNFVNVYLNDKVLAEEIVQDIFVYFWENKEKLEISTSVKSFLFSASKYQSLNHLRNTKNRKRLIGNFPEAAVNSMSEIDESYLDSNELRAILNSAIEQLSPKCREIFVLSKQKEMSNKEIAEQLGVSVKTVENQMTIAFKKMREYLMPFRNKIFVLFIITLFS